ncbi:hypothetical protein EVAR_68621_1 [Eumeta japonica]|uniref:Uncharacterized protein n=1 Tax=Eumeta variegata TaxID=151549 RepID=A0A4C2ACX5_EUMVA|nr:hypothetical protein EVAR_68621_1 [Eumeta japonica]
MSQYKALKCSGKVSEWNPDFVTTKEKKKRKRKTTRKFLKRMPASRKLSDIKRRDSPGKPFFFMYEVLKNSPRSPVVGREGSRFRYSTEFASEIYLGPGDPGNCRLNFGGTIYLRLAPILGLVLYYANERAAGGARDFRPRGRRRRPARALSIAEGKALLLHSILLRLLRIARRVALVGR